MGLTWTAQAPEVPAVPGTPPARGASHAARPQAPGEAVPGAAVVAEERGVTGGDWGGGGSVAGQPARRPGAASREHVNTDPWHGADLDGPGAGSSGGSSGNPICPRGESCGSRGPPHRRILSRAATARARPGVAAHASREGTRSVCGVMASLASSPSPYRRGSSSAEGGSGREASTPYDWKETHVNHVHGGTGPRGTAGVGFPEFPAVYDTPRRKVRCGDIGESAKSTVVAARLPGGAGRTSQRVGQPWRLPRAPPAPTARPSAQGGSLRRATRPPPRRGAAGTGSS